MRFALLLPLMLMIGCASSTEQSDRLLQSGPPRAALIQNVPFIEQSAGHCGPATLAMVFAWAGRPVPVEDLAPRMFTPGMKGTFQADMIGAARRNGMMAIPIRDLRTLFAEIDQGNPVIVFENLALSWAPQWHYAVVFGYDLAREEVVMHSGPEKDKRWDLRKFERSWKLGDYWGLVVLPPNRLSATAGEGEHMVSAAALEEAGHWSQAQVAYDAILTRWPRSLGARIGLGNVAFRAGQYGSAVKHLRQATEEHPESQSARHNRAVAEAALKKSSSGAVKN